MSKQAETWLKHTRAYLQGSGGSDLVKVFDRALARADFPNVSPAEALEAVCADFLAGPNTRTAAPKHRGAANPGAWRIQYVHLLVLKGEKPEREMKIHTAEGPIPMVALLRRDAEAFSEALTEEVEVATFFRVEDY